MTKCVMFGCFIEETATLVVGFQIALPFLLHPPPDLPVNYGGLRIQAWIP